MECKCAETFAAECGCGSKSAEDAPIPSDPRVSPMDDGLHIPADSPALDLPRENAEIGGVDFKADSSPLPPDPRVSPLNEGLYTPSDTPEMAAEMKDSHLTVSQRVLRAIHDQYPALYEDIEEGTQFPPEELEDTGDYDDAVDIAETMQLVRLLSADIRNASEPIREFYDITKTYPRGVENEMYAESFAVENADEVLDDLEDFIGAIAYPENLDDDLRLHNIVKFVWYVYGQEPLNGDDIDDITQALKEWNGEDDESFGAESKFDKLAKEIAEEYEEKGKSPKEAMEIGEATAAKIGRAKFGKKKFAKMGQKAEDDIDFDKSKADRNKDGRISDWERAVGNAVAKGIRDHKGAESAFDRLEDEVADEYEEKGMSDKEAKRIGAAVAYEQGVKKYGKKIMSEAARKGVSARSLERRAEVGPHVPTRIGATTTTRGVVKTFDSIPAGDGHVVGQFTPDMDYAPSGMYGAESITDSIAKGFGSVLGIMSGLIIGGFAMNAVALLKSDDEN